MITNNDLQQLKQNPSSIANNFSLNGSSQLEGGDISFNSTPDQALHSMIGSGRSFDAYKERVRVQKENAFQQMSAITQEFKEESRYRGFGERPPACITGEENKSRVYRHAAYLGFILAVIVGSVNFMGVFSLPEKDTSELMNSIPETDNSISPNTDPLANAGASSDTEESSTHMQNVLKMSVALVIVFLLCLGMKAVSRAILMSVLNLQIFNNEGAVELRRWFFSLGVLFVIVSIPSFMLRMELGFQIPGFLDAVLWVLFEFITVSISALSDIASKYYGWSGDLAKQYSIQRNIFHGSHHT